MNRKDMGNVIKTMRLSRNMTQAELAKAIKRSQSTIGMWERGEREPDLEAQEALADAFNVPISSFYTDHNEPKAGNLDSDFTDRIINAISDAIIPRTVEARIVSFGMDQLSQEERERLLATIRAMFSNRPELFALKKGDDDHDA